MPVEEQDLTLKTVNGRFNYRVGTIIIKDNKLLMVKNDSGPYYSVYLIHPLLIM